MSYFPRYRYMEKLGGPTVIEPSRRYGPSEWVGPKTPGDKTPQFKTSKRHNRRVLRIQVTRVFNYETMLRYPVELELTKICE